MDCLGEYKQEMNVTFCPAVPLKLFGGLGLVWFFLSEEETSWVIMTILLMAE